MEYSVTIKNDSRFTNDDGIVHTWLDFSFPEKETLYFGFSPKEDSGYFNVDGIFDNDEYLKKGYFRAYYAESNKGTICCKKISLYDLIPDNDSGSDFNYTTLANYILESGGVNYLSDVQSPFEISSRIRHDASLPETKFKDADTLLKCLIDDFLMISQIGGQ
ncbi:hypothetical protein HV213_23145 [Klebsiella sp. RHBSTW-00484]|uniref:hypothetical protein n=1 Tax=unclassified Klebsiella TaxID=2608929 RepID=UPI0015E49D04|nr:MULTISPECIES: hypothetical protein [unclassified Klebsiella]MBA7843132.1 hypothetical protein [Klebsiella sp. RHBSTW-00465]QLO38513.1 hypothetical protein HV213_23145 [Klebsiella sp. RHBSTW-00484]QLT78033.1 hypothetical protein HV204_23145 [Klebsiella sp. RHBSTW-00464]